jgi:hypothetical protein
MRAPTGPRLRAATRPRLRTETAIAAAGLALVAALVYGDHVVHGGFLWDDWENAGTTRFGGGSGFLGPFDLRQAAYRPVLQLLLPLPHLVFGAHPAGHLALALVLATAASAAFYALLRAAGAAPPFAIAAAALALLFPWSSSTRLWATASVNLVAIVLLLGAAAISLRALAREDGRGRSALLTAAMCAAAILTYEAVAGLLLLLPVLYRLRAPWRDALRRWRAEALAGGAAAAWVALATTKPESGGGTALEHGVAIAKQGVALAGHAIVPIPGVPAAVGLVLPAAVTAAALLTDARAARTATAGAALSLLALILGWAPFVPGEGKYVPGAPGIYDRVNIVAGFALAALVCSLAALAATLVPRRARLAAAASLLALIAAGWAIQVRTDVDAYARAAATQRAELQAVDAAHPPAGSLVILLHDRTWAAPGVPIFGQPWDLGPALRLRYGDGSIAGFPIARGGASVTCGKTSVTVDARGTEDPPPAPYGRALVVDARTRRATRIDDARSCRAALRPIRASA